jgi:hypothetical protein
MAVPRGVEPPTFGLGSHCSALGSFHDRTLANPAITLLRKNWRFWPIRAVVSAWPASAVHRPSGPVSTKHSGSRIPEWRPAAAGTSSQVSGWFTPKLFACASLPPTNRVSVRGLGKFRETRFWPSETMGTKANDVTFAADQRPKCQRIKPAKPAKSRTFGRDRKYPICRNMGGGRTRARTWDPLIKSQLLYQLSYAPGLPSAGGPARQGFA